MSSWCQATARRALHPKKVPACLARDAAKAERTSAGQAFVVC
jgi:hypothetical protein